MAQKKVYEATETYTTAITGEDITVREGKTRVEQGHPLIQAKPEAWKVADGAANFGLEDASAAPGTGRNAVAPTAHPATDVVPSVEGPAKAADKLGVTLPARPAPDGDITILRNYAKSLGLDLPGNVSRNKVNDEIDAALASPEDLDPGAVTAAGAPGAPVDLGADDADEQD